LAEAHYKAYEYLKNVETKEQKSIYEEINI
jgi:hypothetical protein